MSAEEDHLQTLPNLLCYSKERYQQETNCALPHVNSMVGVVGSSSGAREESNGGAQRTPWEAFLAVTSRQSQVAKLEHGVFRRARFEKKSLAEMEAGAQHSSRCHPASHRRENKRTRKPETLKEGKEGSSHDERVRST